MQLQHAATHERMRGQCVGAPLGRLDHEHPQAPAGEQHRGCGPRAASADDDHVVVAIHGRSPGRCEITRQVIAQVGGVVGGAVDEARLPAPQKRHADQIQTGAGGHAAVMANAALPVENRGIEPRQNRPEPGGPDDRLDLAAA